MSQCLIYYPGLLGPDVPLEELPEAEWPDSLDYAHLLTVFNKAVIEPLSTASVEHRLFNALGISFPAGQDVPVAQVRHQLGFQPINAEQNLFCIDPVYIQIDQEEAILVANESLEISESEARHLIDDLNQHFEQDGISIHYHSPHQWIMTGPVEVTTTSMSTVIQNNIKHCVPEGRDGKLWQRYINEVQMLLHSHEVNQQRELRGEAVINSLWLWGGGRDLEQESIVEHVFSDHDWVAELARFCDVQHSDFPEDLSQPDSAQSTLYVYLDQLDAIKQKDVYRWFEHLKQLNDKMLSPALDNLNNGSIDSLTLFSDTLSLTLNKKDLARVQWAFWKKAKDLKDVILDVRKRYDH